MRLLHIVPVTANVMTDEILRFIAAPLDSGTELVTRQIGKGPASIECEYDEALAAPHILEICAQAGELDCQGIFINCFGDPGVRAARELVDLPVFGGFEPGLLYALGLSEKVSIITVLDNVLGMLHGNIAKAGVRERIASVRVVNMPVLELHDFESMVHGLTEQSLRAVEEDGAGAILFGCTGMIGGAESVRQGLLQRGYDIPVVDPAQASVKMLEACVRLGIRPSRQTYRPVPHKDRIL